MATHSRILAWRIPWTEEPGRLQSMGLQRVRHDRATKKQQQQSYIWKIQTGSQLTRSRCCCVLSRKSTCQERGTSVSRALDVSFLHWHTHDGGQPGSESQIPGPGREADQPILGHVRPGHTAAGERARACVCVCVWGGCQIKPACFYPNWLLYLLSITDCLWGST